MTDEKYCNENALQRAVFVISIYGGVTGEIESAILPLSERDQKALMEELEINDLDECEVASVIAFNHELSMYLFMDGQPFSKLNSLANALNRLRLDFGETAFDAFVIENKTNPFRNAERALEAVDSIRKDLALQENRRYGMFEISINAIGTGRKVCISLPADHSEINAALDKANLFGKIQIGIESCKEIPELNGVSFGETATLDEFNFLAKRIEEVCDDQTQICAYRALMSELPDNICEAINRTYGLETIAVYPCENIEEYGEIVLDNDFLEELDEIPYELYDLLDREKVGALMQEREGGMFIDGYYVIPSGYDPVLAYDGIVLPDADEEPTIEMGVEML